MNSKSIILSFLIAVTLLKVELSQSQTYRTPKAYIADFEKNEDYVKQSLTDYSSAVINQYQDSRVQSTLERIYVKLENINTNLLKNNPGYQGDTSLRDAFLKMNSSTIALLKNKSLRFDDYDSQKNQDYIEIFNCFNTRQQDITNYYALITNYTICKRNFSKKYKVNTDLFFYKKNY